MCSDLGALELLFQRPGAPGPSELFALNKLHAKLYIFDKQILYLGSSNLSITGCERHCEVGLQVDDALLAGQCYQ